MEAGSKVVGVDRCDLNKQASSNTNRTSYYSRGGPGLSKGADQLFHISQYYL